MAEASTPPQEDPFDLGDTSITGDSAPSKATKENPLAGRARRPDGTLLPVNKEPETPSEPTPPSGVIEVPVRPASKHPTYLVEQAREANFTDEEIEATPTNVLGKTLHRLHQQQLAARAELDRERLLVHGQVRNPEPPPAPPEEDVQLDFGTDESGNPLSANDFHPGLVRALKSMSKSQRDENKKLREELAKRDQREEQRELNRSAAVWDAAFSALGKEYEHIVGKGPGREMGQDQAAEYRRRLAILQEAQADPRQLTVAQVKARVKAAVDLLYPPVRREPYAEVARPAARPAALPNGAQQRISEEDWNEGALARPTQRKTEEIKGEALAVRNLAAKLDQELIPDSEELDGFPE